MSDEEAEVEREKYICFTCKTPTYLPENPITAPLTLRVRCDSCDAVKRHMHKVL